MQKIITIREWAAIKRTAQNVSPMVTRKNKVLAKISELRKEIEILNTQIDGFEHGVKAITGGLSSENLMHREVNIVPGKFDKDGNPLKKTSYEPNSCVTFDSSKGHYILTLADPEAASPSAEAHAEKADTEKADAAPASTEETTTPAGNPWE